MYFNLLTYLLFSVLFIPLGRSRFPSSIIFFYPGELPLTFLIGRTAGNELSQL